jgi:hypothetical protein
VSEAERLSFTRDLDEKQKAAAHLGEDFAKMQEKINATLLAAFDRDALVKRRQFLDETTTDLRTRGLRATGSPERGRQADTLEQLLKQDEERRSFAVSLSEQGVTGGQAAALQSQLDAIQQQEQSQLRIKQAVDATATAEQRLQAALASVHAESDAGTGSLIDGSDRIRAAQQAYNEQIQVTIALLQKMREQASDPAQAKAIDDQIQKIKTNATQAQAQVTTFGTKTSAIIGDSIEPQLSGVISGTVKVKDAFKGMLLSISKGFSDFLAKLINELIIKKVLTSFLGGLGGGAGTFFNTPVPAASGAMVPGGYGGGDIAPYMLEPGEIVVPKEVVKAVGARSFSDFMIHILGVRSGTLSVPRIGPVKMSGGGMAPTATPRGIPVPTLTADDATLDRLLSGGNNALITALGRNKEVLRQIVQGGQGAA